ncbi:MAG: hypothetical protein AVDCRST_MAG45-2655 [uncultured Solirubrobacterales bacterium]|uniref:VCBS repeat-containing protein n=1 Tax=uncultured Solirubrobacterales bacterium TaxID=768556 RepID=A0A6J4TJ70_9ACTN|nr:MAG: hypothetical protein AVDCRST_MAG45-2655 [uncultured Solirubrobacterales bacterium]
MHRVCDGKPLPGRQAAGRLGLGAIGVALALAVASVSQAYAAQAVNLGPERSHPAGDLPYSVETADLNGDRVLDIVTPNTVSHDVSVLLGRGDGSFRPAVNFPAGKGPRTAVTTDLDEDGRIDLAVSDVFDRAVLVLRGDGRGGFGPPARLPAGDQPRNLITRDFDRDGHADLAVVNRREDEVGVYLGRGDGTFAAPVTYAAGNRLAVGEDGDAYDLDSADFDRDGRLDLAVANRASNNLSILPGNGDGSFRAGANYPVGRTPFDVTAGDFNRDRNPDLAVGNLDSKSISIFLGNGAGTFARIPDQGKGVAAFTLAVADFDADGRQDLAAVNNANTRYVARKEYPGSASILLGRGDGTFGKPSDHAVGTRPVAIAGDDLDRDGRADLATANRESDDITVLLRTDPGLSLSASRSRLTWPGTTTLRGRLTSAHGDPLVGRRVLLYRRPWVRGAFTRVPGQPDAGTPVAADGTFRLAGARPEWTTDYRARFVGDRAGTRAVASPLAVVEQRPRITLKVGRTDLRLGGSRAITGLVSHHSHAGLFVTVVVRRDGAVVEERRLALDREVDYGFVYRPRRPGDYSFVARFDGHPPGHLPNRTRPTGFRVIR